MSKRRERDRFGAEELAVVLSHYDLGIIESITEFRRGSRRSPKVGIVAERGKYLLKKRDRVRGGKDRMVFSHAIQEHLAARSFPLPQLIKPKDCEDTHLEVDGNLYELFDYVSGHPYCGEGDETIDAGRVLARFHKAMEDFPEDNRFRRTGYHDAVAVQTGLEGISKQVSSHDSAVGRDAEVLGLTTFLFDAYQDAAEAVEKLGYAEWPERITHSDWHPGNLLFKRGRVLAVIDYDCARMGRTASDLANGALQFSMIGGSDPVEWPDHLDLDRLREFVSGYRQEVEPSPRVLQALPYLMQEALIAEAVLPIAATGSFGPFAGFSFLRMIRRKIEWIRNELPVVPA